MNKIFGFLLIVAIIVAVLSAGYQLVKGIEFKNFFRLQRVPGTASSSVVIETSGKKVMVTPETKPLNPSVSPSFKPPFGFKIEELSPHYKKLSIYSVTPARYSGAIAQFSIRTDYSLSEKIDVTGWKVKTNKGEVFIPKAVADYAPYGISPENDILIGGNGSILFSSARSPLNVNFRLNKCTGYLSADYLFQPSLPNNCPSLNREAITSFSGSCQSFILSLSNCRIPTPNEINTYSGNDAGCRQFLDTLNYRGCYLNHSRESDFLSREWRVWLNANLPLDASHDRLLLFDNQDLLVNEYYY